MKTKNLLITFSLLVVMLVAGCNMPQPTVEVGDSQTQVALFAQATLTKFALQQQETPAPEQPTTVAPTDAEVTQAPTTVPPTEAQPTQPPATDVPVVTVVPVTPVSPTATTGPLPTTPSGVTRVSFATGATNHVVSETIPANTTKRYAVRLMQWQMAEISLKSSTTAFIAVTTEKGKQLVDFSNKWTWYRDYATENGDWFIDVRTGAYAADINLSLMAPQRVSFDAGKNVLVAKASIGNGHSHNFIAWANKDQTMTVSLNPNSGMVLSIWKVNGDVLLASSEGKNSYEGKLPTAGDYIITVSNSSGANAEVEMNLTIK